jgi:hypothetical protein
MVCPAWLYQRLPLALRICTFVYQVYYKSLIELWTAWIPRFSGKSCGWKVWIWLSCAREAGISNVECYSDVGRVYPSFYTMWESLWDCFSPESAWDKYLLCYLSHQALVVFQVLQPLHGQSLRSWSETFPQTGRLAPHLGSASRFTSVAYC